MVRVPACCAAAHAAGAAPGFRAASAHGTLPIRTFRSRHHISLRRHASGGTAAVARTSRQVASAPRRTAGTLAGLPLFFSSRARAMPARALMSARVSAQTLRARPKRIAPLAVAAIAVPVLTVLIVVPQLRSAFDPGSSPFLGSIRPIETPASAAPGAKHSAASAAHAFVVRQ